MDDPHALTVTLDPETAGIVRDRLREDPGTTASEIIARAIRADDGERRISDIRARIRAALDDPSPTSPSEDVFRRLRQRRTAAHRSSEE